MGYERFRGIIAGRESSYSRRKTQTVTSSAFPLPDNERLEAAATWHARLSENRDHSEWQAFTAWLEADPRNRIAFDAVDAVAAEVADHAEFLTDDVDPPEHPPAPMPRALWMSRRVWVPVALAATVLIGIVLRPTVNEPPAVQNFATAVGERKDVTLSDGSTVHLNTDTTVSVSLTRGKRRAQIEKGEALFEVVAQTGRPFDVTVGDKLVHVVGTAFNILRHDGEVTIAVKHGVVQVQPSAGGDKTPAVKLLIGDRYVGREGSAAYTLAKIDPAAIAAWEQGRLLFDDVPLSQVASDLSRYVKRPVVVQDENVANMRFSGVLKIEDELTMARRLAAFLPLAVQERADKVVLERGPSN